jgi:hypothetical protein
MYQMAIKYVKWPLNRPNGHYIYLQTSSIEVPPKFTQIKVLGLKKCHLAILLQTSHSQDVCISSKALFYINIASHRIASHRIASHRIASHRIASHRIASHRIAPHHTTPHHTTPHHTTSLHIALHYFTSHHIVVAR